MAEGTGGFYIRDYADVANASAAAPWWSLTFDLVIKLGLVIGLIYLTMWVLRTYLGGAGRMRGAALPSGRLTVLDQSVLAPGRTLYLVEVADRVLVLGATGTSLSTLSEISDPTAIDLLKKRESEPEPPSPFAEQLRQISEGLAAGTPGTILSDKIGELRALAARLRRPASGEST